MKNPIIRDSSFSFPFFFSFLKKRSGFFIFFISLVLFLFSTSSVSALSLTEPVNTTLVLPLFLLLAIVLLLSLVALYGYLFKKESSAQLSKSTKEKQYAWEASFEPSNSLPTQLFQQLNFSQQLSSYRIFLLFGLSFVLAIFIFMSFIFFSDEVRLFFLDYFAYFLLGGILFVLLLVAFLVIEKKE